MIVVIPVGDPGVGVAGAAVVHVGSEMCGRKMVGRLVSLFGVRVDRSKMENWTKYA